MKFPRTLLVVGLTLSLGTVAMAADDTYPIDLAKKEPAVGEAFNKLTAPVSKDADWLKDYGTSQPVHNLKGDAYVLKGCKPHACPDEQYVAVISEDGKKAIGAWIKNEEQNGRGEAKVTKIIWLGEPSDEMKKKLVRVAFWDGKHHKGHRHGDWKEKRATDAKGAPADTRAVEPNK